MRIPILYFVFKSLFKSFCVFFWGGWGEEMCSVWKILKYEYYCVPLENILKRQTFGVKCFFIGQWQNKNYVVCSWTTDLMTCSFYTNKTYLLSKTTHVQVAPFSFPKNCESIFFLPENIFGSDMFVFHWMANKMLIEKRGIKTHNQHSCLFDNLKFTSS